MRLGNLKNQPRAKRIKVDSMTYVLPLVGLILPFLCWTIELILPYPYIIEELGKAVFVFFVWQLPRQSRRIKVTILMGIFFTLSEMVFYLFNFSFTGSMPLFFLRLLLTTTLHITTLLIILLPTIKSKKLILLSFPLAMAVHYLYNNLVPFLNPF